MFQGTSWHKSMHISNRLLNAYTIRQEVISDNIANASTPNFKRTDVNFEADLKRALDSEKDKTIDAYMTHEKHIPFNIKMDYKSVKPNLSVEYDTNYLNNKNNVDIDKEMADHAKNSMRYQMFSQIMSSQYKQMRRLISIG